MKRLIIFILLLPFLPACVNMSSFQEAQVVPSGEKMGTFAVTVTKVTPSAQDLNNIYEDFSFVTPEFMMRGGIGNRMDLGARIWLAFPLLGLSGDFKYQIVDSEAVDLSFDIAASYFGIETVDASIDFLDITPAVMITIPKMGITITPKQVRRRISGDNVTSETQVYNGASISIALGKKSKIIPEIGYFEGEGNEFTYYGIGFRF